MSKADLIHVLEALNNYAYYITNYPETVSDHDEDELRIALQIIQEQL